MRVNRSSKGHTSDRVAPPIMKTNIRFPSLLKSPDACLNTEESLQIKYMVMIRKQLDHVETIRANKICDRFENFVHPKGSDGKISSVNTLIDYHQSYGP